MSGQRKVLFLTNSEYGQANVVLAVCHELLLQNEVEVHIVSWPALSPRVTELNDRLSGSASTTSPGQVTFHTIPGNGMFDAVFENFGRTRQNMPHKPGYAGTAFFRILAPEMLAPWLPDQHLQLVDWFEDLARKLDADLIVLDPFLAPAHDMARKLQWNHVILSPCSLMAPLIPNQPWLAGFWKYPGIATGFPFPLPWSNLPESLYCIFSAMSMLFFGPVIKLLAAARKAHGIEGQLATFEGYVKDVPHICPSLSEIDLPLQIPENAHFVGPILLAEQPLSESDPDLLKWLQKAPTVLINLGTHNECLPDKARELAKGLRVLLDSRSDVQILWKFKAAKGTVNDIFPILGKEIKEDRVRVESWLQSDPTALLQSGCLIATVHHGGANSWAGVPQVILAQWYDCYDYSCKAEYLGIGVYGNKSVAPEIDGTEFGNALLKVVGTEDRANKIRDKAEEVGRICQRSGGRRLAAELIMKCALK